MLETFTKQTKINYVNKKRGMKNYCHIFKCLTRPFFISYLSYLFVIIFIIIIYLLFLFYFILMIYFISTQVCYRVSGSSLQAVSVPTLRIHGVEAVQTGLALAPVLPTRGNIQELSSCQARRGVTPGFHDTWQCLRPISKFYH